jgi:hypothetical protein
MPEGMNVEIVHRVAESGAEGKHKASLWAELLEIAEAAVLAVVAVATAWSGYNSAEWDGRQAFLYGTSARLRVEAAATREEARQYQVFDALTLNAWIQAKAKNDEDLAAIYEHRFTPEFRVAFEEWLKADPLKNPKAPRSPILMPEYYNAQLVQAQQLHDEATAAFTAGTQARETAEKYVRITVVLATVLFLIAVGQRFKRWNVRMGLFAVATVLVGYALVILAMYPRL